MDQSVFNALVKACIASHEGEYKRLVAEALESLADEDREILAQGYPVDPLQIKLSRARGDTFEQCLAEIIETHKHMIALNLAREAAFASAALEGSKPSRRSSPSAGAALRWGT